MFIVLLAKILEKIVQRKVIGSGLGGQLQTKSLIFTYLILFKWFHFADKIVRAETILEVIALFPIMFGGYLLDA